MYLGVMYTSFAAFDCVSLPMNGLVSKHLVVLLPFTNCVVSRVGIWMAMLSASVTMDMYYIVGVVVSFVMTLPMLFIGLLPFSRLTQVRNDNCSSSSCYL